MLYLRSAHGFVHWRDPPSYISCSGKTPPVLYLCALYGVLVGACVHVKRRDPSYSCLHMIFLPLYQNEKMLTETKIRLEMGPSFGLMMKSVPKLNIGYKRSWCQLNQNYKLVFWQLIAYEGVKKSSNLWHLPRNVGRPLPPPSIVAYCHKFYSCIPSLYFKS